MSPTDSTTGDCLISGNMTNGLSTVIVVAVTRDFGFNVDCEIYWKQYERVIDYWQVYKTHVTCRINEQVIQVKVFLKR